MESLLLAIQHLFPTVLRMSLSGSILVLIVVGFRFLLQKAPKWLHCLLWVPVAMRLLFPTLPASPVSLMPPGDTGIVSETVLSHGMDQTMPTVEFETPWDRAINRANEAAGQNVSIGTSAAPSEYLPFLWVMGTGLMLLYALVSTLRLRREVSVSLRQRGNIRVCDEVASPFILGIFRPVIYLPSSLSEEDKRFVLAHERAHLRRLDHVWKPLGFLVLSVHWFNPFCWLAYVLLCRDIELACDEKVIRELGRAERAAYSQTLLNCSAHRILAACPVAFGETDVKTRVKAVLNYKKPAFWIILAAVLGCLVLVVCFATNPMQEQDLSFLNYKNAIPLIGQNDTAPYATLVTDGETTVTPGVADAKALAQFLDSAKWTKRRAPSPSPEPTHGYLQFEIEGNYTITVYAYPRLAAVRFGNDIRYYRTGWRDYEAALATFIPAPSTEPDRPPEQSALPTPVPPPSLPEIDAGIVPADPEAFLLGFADAEIVSIYDEFSREYAAPDKSFTEIISAETWTAHAFNEFPASIALRLIVMRSGDWELRIEDDGEDCLFAAYAVGRSASDPIIFFDCGENLMDDLMAWAIARQDEAHIEERIEYMLSKVAGKTEPYALSDYTDGDMNGVPKLCMQLQSYAREHQLSVDQMRGLMLGTQNLDGAYAEGYAALLNTLYTLQPVRFVEAYFRADESVQPFLFELYGTRDPSEELAKEQIIYSTIYNNLESYLKLSWGIDYGSIAPSLADMDLHRVTEQPTEAVDWIHDVGPEWYVLVPVEANGINSTSGLLTVYIGAIDRNELYVPIGTYFTQIP